MSVILQCDICGKNSTMMGTEFSIEPICCAKKNFKGDDFKVFLTISLQNNIDIKAIEEVMEKISAGTLTQPPTIIPKTPCPNIYNFCKRELINDLLKSWRPNKTETNLFVSDKASAEGLERLIEALKQYEVKED